MTKILFADHIYMNEKASAILAQLGELVYFDGSTEEELASQSSDADIIVSEITRITENIINGSNKLKAILVWGVGYDHVDVAAASRKSVYVVNTKGPNAEAVAELVFFMILDRARNACRADNLVRNRSWIATESGEQPPWLLGTELFGKTLGVVGFGEIGRRVARIANGFRMRVLATSPNLTERQALEAGAELVDLNSLLKESDFVTINTRLGVQTRGLIGKKELGMMKKSSVIINTSRGAVIDESALITSLERKEIAGAGLDVFSEEPTSPDNKLLTFENVVLSPHVGGNTREANDACVEALALNVKVILEGKIPENVVNLSEIMSAHSKSKQGR